MGAWQMDWPAMPITLGIMCILLACCSRWHGLTAAMRQRVGIPVFGLAWAVFWIGFLRVGAQSALLLGPPAALLLLLRWLG